MAKKLTKPSKGAKAATKPAAGKPKQPKRVKKAGETKARGKARDAIAAQGIGTAVDDSLRRGVVLKTYNQQTALDGTIAAQRGEMGNLFKRFEEKGEDRTALKWALKLKKMDSARQNATLRNLLLYCRFLDVGAQEDLFETSPTATDASLAGAGQSLPIGDEDPKKQAEAADRGKEAGLRGKKNLDANPYNDTVFPKCHKIWADNWHAGQADLLKDGLGKSKPKKNGNGKHANGGSEKGESPAAANAEAFEAGDQCAAKGGSIEDNPHKAGTPEADRFIAGFNNRKTTLAGNPAAKPGNGAQVKFDA